MVIIRFDNCIAQLIFNALITQFAGHIQISQAPTRDSPDSEGEINYRYILKLLEDLGYEGFIGLEYKPTKASADSIGWIKEWGYSL